MKSERTKWALAVLIALCVLGLIVGCVFCLVWLPDPYWFLVLIAPAIALTVFFMACFIKDLL